MEQVFKVLADNVDRTRELLFAAIPAIPEQRSCHCHEALASGPLGEASN
jgi:hypothetical protein